MDFFNALNTASIKFEFSTSNIFKNWGRAPSKIRPRHMLQSHIMVCSVSILVSILSLGQNLTPLYMT